MMEKEQMEFPKLPDTIEDARIALIRTCSLLATIMEDSDIDESERFIQNEWKQRIMTLLITYGYTWPKDADEANKVFGERFGVDWK